MKIKQRFFIHTMALLLIICLALTSMNARILKVYAQDNNTPVTTLYVAQSGNDTNEGLSQSTALATLGAAYAKLPEKGTVDTNRIVIIGALSTDPKECFTKPAKITAETPEKGILTLTADSTLKADTAFEGLTLMAEDKAIVGKAEANPKPNLTFGLGIGTTDAPAVIGSVRDIGTLTLKNASLKLNATTPVDKIDDLRLTAQSRLTLGGSAAITSLGSYNEDNITPTTAAQSTLGMAEGSELSLTGAVFGVTGLAKDGSDPQKGITVKAPIGTSTNAFTGENITAEAREDGTLWQIPPVPADEVAAPLELNALIPSLTTTAKIGAGRQYGGVSETTQSVNVSDKSAVTVEFNTTVSVAAATLTSITLNNTLPAGTKITMVDLSNAVKPAFYQYTMPSTVNNNIALTAFTKMESNEVYKLPTLAISTSQKLIFVVDFSAATGATNGSLSLTHLATLLPFESTKATYITASATNSITATVSPPTVNAKDTVNITLNATTDPKDTRFKNGGLLAVSLLQNNTPVSFKNITIKSADTYYAPNGAGNIVYIPVASGTVAVPLTLQINGSLNGTYTLKAELKDRKGTTAAAIDNTATLTVQKPDDGLRITSETTTNVDGNTNTVEKRVFDKATETTFPLQLYWKTDNKGSKTVTIECRKKEGDSYKLVEDAIASIDQSAANSGGVFTLNNVKADGNPNSININLNTANLTPGTYQFIWAVKSGTQTIIQVPYNFIIK